MLKIPKILLFFTCSCLLVFLVSPAGAYDVNVYTVHNDIQDEWDIEGRVHEFGNQPPFPDNEWITSSSVITTYVPCISEYEGGTNYEVTITNMTGKNQGHLYYVADPETTITNWDELVGQVGDPVPEEAFLIDWWGENTPLVYESMTQDAHFEIGETWKFVLQDYTGLGPAHAFDSLGIASFSTGYPPSTGSIIPEPATIILLGIGGLGLLSRRKK